MHRSVTLETPDETRGFGRGLSTLLRAGDLVVLTGSLGAGKTTLAQGIGDGLHVRGPVTSPTFVIARAHPSLADGPPLVHVDAYRLGGLEELDDLDLDATVEDSVTVVEWGHGVAEDLVDDHVELTLVADPHTEVRTLTVATRGKRWSGPVVSTALDALCAVPAGPG
jgi:tRNA threonylcarbamoyladenosine biosynthesis protein TsaE